jgi:membrane protein implicated in regulation of membrane protease activity
MAALGVTLLVMALVLVLAEAHLSTGGLIGAGASVAGIAGVVVLLLAAGAGAVVVLIVALCVAAASISSLALLRRRVLSPARMRPRTGTEALVGHVGVVRAGDGPSPEAEAQVFLDGSLWRAEPSPVHHEAELYDGERVVQRALRASRLTGRPPSVAAAG